LPYRLALERKIAIRLTDDGFHLETDAEIRIAKIDGLIRPFEHSFRDAPIKEMNGFVGIILGSLSERLTVDSRQTDQHFFLEMKQGKCTTFEQKPQSSTLGTTMCFAPDTGIFEQTDLSSEVFHSYFRRLSYLHSGIEFSINTGDGDIVYFHEDGVRDMFIAMSTPYQLMHEPVCLVAEEDDLRIEFALACHSWSNDVTFCFMNNGRAVKGGTHEDGFLETLTWLKQEMDFPEYGGSGLIALACFHYPNVIYEGCIKDYVGNKGLKKRVHNLMKAKLQDFLVDNPAIKKRMLQSERFLFPEIWND